MTDNRDVAPAMKRLTDLCTYLSQGSGVSWCHHGVDAEFVNKDWSLNRQSLLLFSETGPFRQAVLESVTIVIG